MDVRTICLVVVVAWVGMAPASVIAQKTPDVEVTDVQWTIDVNSRQRLKGNYSSSPQASPDFIQEVSAIFRNVGAKTVKSVTWEYVAYEDSNPSKKARAYKFRSKSLLHPGESMRLSKQGLNIQHRKHVEVHIVRIEYDDGTVWQRVKA